MESLIVPEHGAFESGNCLPRHRLLNGRRENGVGDRWVAALLMERGMGDYTGDYLIK